MKPLIVKQSLFNPDYFDIKFYCPICKSIVGVSDKKQETFLIINPANHCCYQQIDALAHHGKA